MRFRVSLDIFAGPLDLLLYLVRKQELEILDIPLAAVTQQYLEILSILEQIDVDAVGDFVEIAVVLLEIKSQSVLPRPEEHQDELPDPAADLVQRLLEYKRFKEAASHLDERKREWQQRFARRANDLPTTTPDPAVRPVQQIEIWDLVTAFRKVLEKQARAAPTEILYDDTPIDVYMKRILTRVLSAGQLKFADLFEAGMHRSQLVGMFLALLELIREASLETHQAEPFGDIVLSSPTPTAHAA